MTLRLEGLLKTLRRHFCRGILTGWDLSLVISLSGTLRVSGIDFDNVIHEDGTLEPFAEEIVGIMDNYTEYSPSGTGLHILCETVLKDIGRKRKINIFRNRNV